MSYPVRRNVLIFVVFLLVFTARASGQLNYGETSLNLNATVSAGYSDDFSNFGGSSHSIVGGGYGNLSGSYFNPKFLSFDIQPYYNQSRANSTFQSLTASSGVNANAQIFSGSHYPGSISYATSYNTSGNFNVPGLANYTTHGNNDAFAMNWGIHLKDRPTVNFNFSDAGNSYSIYGSGAQGTLHSDTFSVSSAYKIAGFSLNGGYQFSGSNTLTPQFLAGQPAERANTGANSFFFGMGHNLPLNGSVSAAVTRLDLSTHLSDVNSSERYNTSVDTLSSTVNFEPRQRLTVGASFFYTDNLEGTLYNTLLTSGVTVPQSLGQQRSNDLSLTGYANYELPAEHLNMHAFVERQQESFMGISFASSSYNGSAMYSNRVLGGSLNGVLGLTLTSIDTSQQTLLGLNTSVNYTHQVNRWTLNGGFGYSQDTQTVLIGYTSSGYNYSGSVGRKIHRRSYWSAYASGQKSLLTNVPGSANSSQSYSTSIFVARFGVNGSFSDSSGNALLTSTGLVATPIPLPVLNPADVVFYSGKSYSAGLSANPTHGLTMSGTFAKALSTTQASLQNSLNNNQSVSFLITYNVRKLSFITGYTRLLQGFSLSGTPPTMVGSLFVGISRWFNFF
jgi:hypothetical protein